MEYAKKNYLKWCYPLCILESDVMQKDTLLHSVSLLRGLKVAFLWQLPSIYLPNVLLKANIHHIRMVGVSGLTPLPPKLFQCFPLCSGGLFLWLKNLCFCCGLAPGFWSRHHGALHRCWEGIYSWIALLDRRFVA